MSGKRIQIDYTPQRYQAEIHNDKHRFKVLDIGRRGGKTEFVLNELIKEATRDPGLYFYIAPSYRQAKSIAWTRLKALLKPAKQFWKFNEQELYAEELNTATRIELKGADNEESLLGVGLKGVVFDESAMIKETVWPRIVRPMLADSQGWAIFISTPKGKNWFWDLYRLGCDPNNPDWKSWKYPTSINAYIKPEEIEEMRKDMPERLFTQEVMAEFLDDSTGVFRGVRACLCGILENPKAGRFYVMGVDLAKTEDYTVLTVIDSVTREIVAFERFQNVSWNEQKLKIQDLAHRYNNAMCIIDSTGIGDPFTEDLESANISLWYNEQGKAGYKFTNTSKNQLIDHLAISIEQRRITIPRDLSVLIEELQIFEYSLTTSGNITYQAPDGKHDDCVISLALAVWGIRSQLREAQVVNDWRKDIDMVDRQGAGTPINQPEYEYEFQGY